MTWKYDDDKCRCGLVETEKHVLFECLLYEERGRWRGTVRDLKDTMDEYETIKGYCVRSETKRKRNNEIYESNENETVDRETVVWSDM